MSRHASAQAPFDGVTTYLSWDHDRLDAILTEVCLKVDAGAMDGARVLYREFDEGLTRHIRIEEELLFPVFEARTGITEGPTAVMRLEHREIEKAMGLMREGLRVRNAGAFREGLAFLRATLPDHNSKEEHILYPTTDRLLSDSERAAFSTRLQRE